MKTRKLGFETLESRFAPALVLAGGAFTFDHDPGQDLVVMPSASVRFTADVTVTSITADKAVISVDTGCTLTAQAIDGGTLAGPGTFEVAGLSNARISSSATVHASVNAINVVNQGLLTMDHTSLTDFVNGSAGRLLVNGPVGGGIESWGQMIVAPSGYVSGALDLQIGSVTTIQRQGALDGINDGIVDGTINLVGGLLTVHGIANGTTNVGAAGYATGSGLYYEVLTHDGGTFSPGGSPSTQATFGGDLFGAVSLANLTATGTVTVFDPDNNQSAMIAGTQTSLYGIFSIDADGHWIYALDPNDADTILVLAHAGAVTEGILVRSVDGSEATIFIRITTNG